MKYFIITNLIILSVCRLFGQNTIKPIVESNNGMVVSTHPIASKVGVEVLQKGGNAIDAAVAVNFALAVVHPAAGNIGGGGFLVYRNSAGEKFALDYREKAPGKGSRDMYLDQNGNAIPEKSQSGILSVGVPGTVAGVYEMHQKFGKLPWREIVHPSVVLARDGVELTEKEARGLNRQKNEFIKYNPGKTYLLNELGEWKKVIY